VENALAEQWRASAEAEVEAAKALRATGQNWGQVYWHAGFAIEQILKAIRIKHEGLEEWPGVPTQTRAAKVQKEFRRHVKELSI
jgi:hypothetical protein